MLALAPRAQMLLGISANDRFKLRLLDRVAKRQVVVLPDEGEEKGGEIGAKRQTRHQSPVEGRARRQKDLRRYFKPRRLRSLSRMIKAGQIGRTARFQSRIINRVNDPKPLDSPDMLTRQAIEQAL